MNMSMFLSNKRCSCSFSSLDSKELTYVNFSDLSSTIDSRESMANRSFSSALTWATNCGCYAGV